MCTQQREQNGTRFGGHAVHGAPDALSVAIAVATTEAEHFLPPKPSTTRAYETERPRKTIHEKLLGTRRKSTLGFNFGHFGTNL